MPIPIHLEWLQIKMPIPILVLYLIRQVSIFQTRSVVFPRKICADSIDDFLTKAN